VLSGGIETILSGATATSATVSGGGFMQLGLAPFNGQPGSAGGTATARSCRVVSRL
jgi:autotransporter passenger strand-loop-strand repeat protein